MAVVETTSAEVTEQPRVRPARKATRAKTLAALLAAVAPGSCWSPSGAAGRTAT